MITSTGDTAFTLLGVAIANDSGGSFSILRVTNEADTDVDLLVVVPPYEQDLVNGVIKVHIRFTPTASGPWTADLRIDSEVLGEEPTVVSLTGAGLPPPPLEECLRGVLDFFRDGVATGQLDASGPSNVLHAFENRLGATNEVFGDLALGCGGCMEGGCNQLENLVRFTDGSAPPRDFVGGPARETLESMMIACLAELSCP